MIRDHANPIFQSKRHDWATPRWLFQELDREFGFTLDVAATPDTAKCDRFFTPEDDALLQRWEGVCWMNPPYGAAIPRFVAKAYEESQMGATVVCLLPSRTGAAWFHDYALKGEVRFLRGRLRFDNPDSKYNKSGKDAAPFDFLARDLPPEPPSPDKGRSRRTRRCRMSGWAEHDYDRPTFWRRRAALLRAGVTWQRVRELDAIQVWLPDMIGPPPTKPKERAA